MIRIASFRSLLVIACLQGSHLIAQTPSELTLTYCQEQAERNYPLTQQYDLIGQMSSLDQDNIQQDLRPNISLFAQASYQSAVTSLPIEIPGAAIPQVSKDQYKVYGQVSQPLTNSKLVLKKKELALSQADIDKKRVEVELYQLREKVDALFFGTLMLDQRLVLMRLLQTDLNAGMSSLQTAIENGVAISSDRTHLRAEQIALEQQMLKVKSKRDATIELLGAFIQQSIDSSTTLVVPDSLLLNTNINRPEIELIDLESLHAATSMDLIDLKNKPRLAAFLQAGLGRPALNFLQNDFQPYFLGGLQFQWNLNGLFTRENDKELNLLGRKKIAVQREVFLFNTNSAIKSEVKEIEKFQQLVIADRALVKLRNQLKETARVQLENGIIDASDYVTYVVAEDRARQHLAIHEMELLKTQYLIKHISGN